MAIYNYEYLLSESYIINEPDILYNKDKWDNNEINLLCITGHVGSGKTTLANSKEKEDNKIEIIHLDSACFVADKFTMGQLKEYGDLMYSYFNGPGKKFYVTKQEVLNEYDSQSPYVDKMYPDFVHYAMKWADSHKNKKYILEGVQFFGSSNENEEALKSKQIGKLWFEPSEFDNYAFYIKGTSVLISAYRAAKRDASTMDNKKDRNEKFKKRIKQKISKWMFFDEKRINVFRRYFKNKMKNNK